VGCKTLTQLVNREKFVYSTDRSPEHRDTLAIVAVYATVEPAIRV